MIKLSGRNQKNIFRIGVMGKQVYPVVDACMKQLNTTGYMHNRGRFNIF